MAAKDYKHGLRAGYTKYRYGGTKPKRPLPILSADQFDSAVRRIAELLGQWQLSPFQFEASCRHAIRSSLCLKGHSWVRSDAEAERVVNASLGQLRAVRPTHDQGQPQYTVSTDYCLQCHSPMEPEDIARGRRFCSSECARMMLVQRSYETTLKEDRIGMQAYDVVRRARMPAKKCMECEAEFHPRPDNDGQRYCSKLCADKALISIPEHECDHCGAAFRSKQWMHRETRNFGRFCSAVCFHANRQNIKIAKVCDWCGDEFNAKATIARFCSSKCQCTAERYSKGTRPKRLAPHVFDHFFTMPINGSRPAWLTPERFDELVAADQPSNCRQAFLPAQHEVQAP